MNITHLLLGEHAVFYDLLRHLEEVVPGSDEVQRIRAMVAMLVAALKRHADLEEEILFQPLEEELGKHNSILSILRTQHEEIEVSLARLLETEHPGRACQMLSRVQDLIRDHFSREEGLLYPAAERLLDEDTLTRMGVRWAEERNRR